MSKIALSMIVSGDENLEQVERALDSVIPYLDGAYITVTTKDKSGLQEMATRKGVEVSYKPNSFHHSVTSKEEKFLTKYLKHEPHVSKKDKLFRFHKARQFAMEQIPNEYDWMIWLDADDIVRGSDKIRGVVEQCEKNGVHAVYANYIYQADIQDGKIVNVVIEHMRERLVKKEFFKWEAPIHETLIEQIPTTKAETFDFDVLHLSSTNRMMKALYRNIKTLELSIAETKGADPRPVYYLGKAYFDVATHEKKEEYFKRAQVLFSKYLFGTQEHDFNNRSGWPEERSQCWEYQAEIHRHFGELEEAVLCGLNALKESEIFPSTYLSIALSYLHMQQFERAIFWVQLASKVPQPKTTLVNNPKDIQARALEILYNAKIQQSKLDEAWAAATKLHKLLPDNKEIADRLAFVEGLKKQRDLTKSYVEIAKYLKQFQGDKLLPLVSSIPPKLADNQIMNDLIKEVLPPREWGEDEIALFCGPGFTEWNPDIYKNPGDNFIGGSEEAVIHIAESLTKEGWKVTVFNNPGVEGEYNGVTYLNHFKFNLKDTFNILISWRQPQLADVPFNAKKFYVWCHDIQRPLEYTEERLEKIEKVIVLSPWHRKNISNVPDDKIMISSNGVDV